MAAFEYTALDRQGRQQDGVIQGETARIVRQDLRDRGLTPLDVKAIDGTGRRSGDRLWRTERATIMRQLATLTRAGLPLAEALAAITRQLANRRQQRIVAAVRARVNEGYSLASGMREFPRAFPELVAATVEAGEESGRLDQVLERVADYTEASANLARSTWLALLYPSLLAFVAIAVAAGLVGYVVPQVMQVFTHLNKELPALTQALIAISDFVVNWGMVMLVLIIVFVVASVFVWRNEALRHRIQAGLLKLPVVGRLMKTLASARFARTLSILLSSGVPVVNALTVSAGVISILPIRAQVELTARRVREGEGLAQCLERGGWFPPVAQQLVASGERSGELAPMLERSAEHLERNYADWLEAAIGLIQPLMILAVGALVLMIVLAILLPIFDINQLVS